MSSTTSKVPRTSTGQNFLSRPLPEAVVRECLMMLVGEPLKRDFAQRLASLRELSSVSGVDRSTREVMQTAVGVVISVAEHLPVLSPNEPISFHVAVKMVACELQQQIADAKTVLGVYFPVLWGGGIGDDFAVGKNEWKLWQDFDKLEEDGAPKPLVGYVGEQRVDLGLLSTVAPDDPAEAEERKHNCADGSGFDSVWDCAEVTMTSAVFWNSGGSRDAADYVTTRLKDFTGYSSDLGNFCHTLWRAAGKKKCR